MRYSHCIGSYMRLIKLAVFMRVTLITLAVMRGTLITLVVLMGNLIT